MYTASPTIKGCYLARVKCACAPTTCCYCCDSVDIQYSRAAVSIIARADKMQGTLDATPVRTWMIQNYIIRVAWRIYPTKPVQRWWNLTQSCRHYSYFFWKIANISGEVENSSNSSSQAAWDTSIRWIINTGDIWSRIPGLLLYNDMKNIEKLFIRENEITNRRFLAKTRSIRLPCGRLRI